MKVICIGRRIGLEDYLDYKMAKIIWAILVIFWFIWIILVSIYDSEHASYISIGIWFIIWIRMYIDD